MTSRISHVSELPDWFNLDNYGDAAKLDAAGWYEQLSLRRDLRSFLQRDTSIDHYLIQIRSKPIVDLESDPPFCYHGRAEVLDAKSRTPKFALGIHVVTALDLIERRRLLDESRRVELDAWYDSLESEKMTIGELKAIHKDWFDEPASSSYVIGSVPKSEAIDVNLSLPDALLIKGFKQFLTMCREEPNRAQKGKRYRAPNFDQLHKFSVLPYIDLTLWGLQKNVVIPNRVIADAIFAKGEGGEEVVRKTTRKLADKWMRHLDIVLAEVANIET